MKTHLFCGGKRKNLLERPCGTLKVIEDLLNHKRSFLFGVVEVNWIHLKVTWGSYGFFKEQ
jgi:hypothetical protein